MTTDAPLSEASFVIRYTAYELVNIPERSIYNVPAPGMEVVAYADYRALASRVAKMESVWETREAVADEVRAQRDEAERKLADAQARATQLEEIVTSHEKLDRAQTELADALKLKTQALELDLSCYRQQQATLRERVKVLSSAIVNDDNLGPTRRTNRWKEAVGIAKQALATGAEGQ